MATVFNGGLSPREAAASQTATAASSAAQSDALRQKAIQTLAEFGAEADKYKSAAQKRAADIIRVTAQTNAAIANALAAGDKELADKVRKSGASLEEAIAAQGAAGSPHARKSQGADLDRARERAMADIQAQIEAEGKIYDQQAKQKAAAIAYASGLEEQTKTRKAQLDLQLQSIGMSDREIQQAQALLQIREQYNRAVQEINGRRSAALAINPKADVSGFDSEIAAQKLNLDTQTEQQKDYYANLLQLEGDWREGATRGMKQFMDSAANVAGQTETLFENAFNGLTDSLVNFVTTGKLNFKDLGNTIVSTLLRIELQMAESKLASWIAGLIAPGGNTLDTAAIAAGNYTGPHALGGVFAGPITPYALGGIVTKPTLFEFAKGTGLMGEAGPEAIMPLSRGPDGKLGVKAQAGGGDVIVNVQNNGGEPATVSQSKDSNGNDIITVMINAAANEVDKRIARGGSTYKVMQQTFGLSRRGVPVAG